MTNRFSLLLSFLHSHFFSSQSTDSHPPSTPMETSHPQPTNVPKQGHITIPIHSNSPSTSSASSLSSSPGVELERPKEELPLPNHTTPTPSLDPISENIRKQDLGRHVLVLVIPIVVFLLTTYKYPLNVSIYATLPVFFLCIGFVAIWNGILLRGVFHHISNGIEIFGMSLILLAFYGIIARFLPPYEIWIPFLCWVLSLLPFLVCCFYKRRGASYNDCPGGLFRKPSLPLLPL